MEVGRVKTSFSRQILASPKEHFTTKTNKMKQKLHEAIALTKRIWSYKYIIVILALVVANIYQTFPVQFALPSTVMAYEKETVSEKINTANLIKVYKEQILKEMDREAEIRATRRVFEEAGVHADSLNPYLSGE